MSAELAISIGRVLGATLQPRPAGRVHGGSINECYRWESDAGPIFVKIAPARHIAMFEAEAAGLAELRRANAVRVPRVLCVGTDADASTSTDAGTSTGTAWLALEWIQSGAPSRATDYLPGWQPAQR